jgi:type III secretory pathway component EscR
MHPSLLLGFLSCVKNLQLVRAVTSLSILLLFLTAQNEFLPLVIVIEILEWLLLWEAAPPNVQPVSWISTCLIYPIFLET